MHMRYSELAAGSGPQDEGA